MFQTISVENDITIALDGDALSGLAVLQDLFTAMPKTSSYATRCCNR